MNLSDVTDGLAAAIKAETNLRVEANVPPKVAAVPLGYIERATIEYLLDQSEDGMSATLTLTVIVGAADYARDRKTLDGYLSSTGEKSIYQAVHRSDLGNTCDYALVRGVEDIGLIELGGNSYVGCRFVIEVLG